MSSDLSRRERKKAESRERMVACAAALFAARGYDATTMEDIGQCADLSRATVFNYFPRKEDLVVAWFDGHRADIAGLVAASEELRDDPTSGLRAVFRAFAHIFEEDPRIGRGMVRSWLQAGGPLLTPESGTTRLLAGVVRAGQERGGIAREVEPDRAGLVLFDVYLGVLYRWVTAEHDRSNLEEELVAALDLVLEGMTPTAGGRA